jgi:DNA/RNA endonuclease YhcR with UshA esterase domain
MKKAFIVMAGIIFLSSCVKDEFDNPPSTNVDPDITANRTIAQLKTLAVTNQFVQITQDIVVSGIINSDDKSGNIYKQIIFQDSTAGILVNVDLNSYYALYPKGRRIFVKCQGLYIAYDNGMIQLGVLDNSGNQPALGRIPQGIVDRHILRGVWGQTITPKVVTLGALANFNPAYENQLVTFNNVEFVPADTAETYANAPAQQSLARIIEDCCGNTAEIYSSGFSTFASALTPKGKGSITCIYQVYNSSVQLTLNDVSDVNMSGTRCGTSSSIIGTGALMNISDIRNLYFGCGGVFAAGTILRGTIISDRTTGNITSNNIVVQDGTAGIIVRFTSANGLFNLNDSVEINLSGDSLTTFSGLLQVNQANIAAVTVLGTGTVTPHVATIAQIIANAGTWESTLLKINGVALSGGGTYGSNGGNVTLTDASGAMEMFTRSSATFSATPYPAGVVSVTGYLSGFNGLPEINIRNTTDVQ